MAHEDPVAIRTENLSKKFRQVEALDHLNLEVSQGAIYALVGPNGAGKTTAINILMNILGPTSGRAEVCGVDSRKIAGAAFESIGYISENQQLPLWMTVSSFLSYLRPFYPTWDRTLEEKLVRTLELPRDRKLRALSRGMRMKAALASSLAYRPRLIVMDEPFSGLDPLVRDQLIQAMLDLAAESTVFVSSHDLAEVETLASHVGFLDSGRLRLSEELDSLTTRFREIEVTPGPSEPASVQFPTSWIHLQKSPSLIRFVATRFDEKQTPAEIKNVFGDVRDIAVTPMSLRNIFLTMAKTRPDNGGGER
ncbi:MAG: ABC transporter ATP-binding protein [Candidatus Acidiferrales bacterium]